MLLQQVRQALSVIRERIDQQKAVEAAATAASEAEAEAEAELAIALGRPPLVKRARVRTHTYCGTPAGAAHCGA